MQIKNIKNILARLSDPIRFDQHRDGADAVAPKAADASATGAASSSPSSSRLREILAGYDVSNISPKAFSELLQKLQQSGLISDKDLQELSQIRTDLDREGVAPDQRVNLLEKYAKRVQAAEQADTLQAAGTDASTASLRRCLDWLAKFAAAHASPEAAAFNALA
jgi:transaldolase